MNKTGTQMTHYPHTTLDQEECQTWEIWISVNWAVAMSRGLGGGDDEDEDEESDEEMPDLTNEDTAAAGKGKEPATS